MAGVSASLLSRHLRGLVSSPSLSLSDPELLRRYGAHADQAAFGELLRRHGPMVFGVCRRVLGQASDAEDALQATFLVLARKAGSLRRPEALAAWLHGVAVRTARSARARRPSFASPLPDCPGGGEGPLEAASWAEVRQVLDEELGRLSARCRAVLVLCYLEGLTRDEAARRLGWSLATVKRRLESGRRLLRQRLLRRGVGPLGLALGVAAAEGLQAAVAPGLRESILQAAAGAARPTAAVLADAVCRWGGAAKALATATLLAVVGVALAGARCLMTSTAHETQTVATGGSPAAPAESQRKDLHGDPLPEGALARFGTVQQRAASADMVLSPDGKTVLTCGYQGRVLHFYDAASGRLRGRKPLPGGRVAEHAFSPDGRYLALWRLKDGPSPLVLVETASGKQSHPFTAQYDEHAQGAAFSADSRFLVMVTSKSGRLLNLHTGKIRTLENLDPTSHHLALSPQGKRLVLCPQLQTLLCLDTDTGKTLWQIKGEGDNEPRMAFSADGKLMVAAGLTVEGRLLVVDAATGKALSPDRLPPVKNYCRDCALQGDTLALLVQKRTLLWDLKAGREQASLAGAGWNTTPHWNRVALSPDGKSAFTLGELLQRWDAHTGKPLYPDTGRLGHLGSVLAVAISPDGRRVATAAREGTLTVRIWDRHSSRLLHTLPGHGDFSDANLFFTPDSKELIAAGRDNTIRVWDVASGRETRHWHLRGPGEKGGDLDLEEAHLSADGKTLTTLILDPGEGMLNGQPGPATLWDVGSGKRLFTRPNIKPLFGAAIRADGKQLALEGGDIYDIATGARRRVALPPETDLKIGRLVYSPDGALLAGTLSNYKERNFVTKPRIITLQVWEAATGKAAFRLTLDEEMEDDCRFAFTPDSRQVLVIGPETIRLRDLLSGREVFRRKVLGGTGWPFAFSPEGQTLLIGHWDTTAMLWDLSSASRRARPAALGEKRQEELWADLAAEPRRAWAAVFALADHPAEAVALIRGRLKPAAPVAAASLRQWLEDLDSVDFDRREGAARSLAKCGRQAEPALRKALPESPALEVRRRIERLLEVAATPHGEEVRAVRAVVVLRQAGTAEARKLLAELAEGDLGAWLSQEARRALEAWREGR